MLKAYQLGITTGTSATTFADQKFISAYAVAATKFMSQLGIIKGDSSGNFMPKAITAAQTAANYGFLSINNL